MRLSCRLQRQGKEEALYLQKTDSPFSGLSFQERLYSYNLGRWRQRLPLEKRQTCHAIDKRLRFPELRLHFPGCSPLDAGACPCCPSGMGDEGIDAHVLMLLLLAVCAICVSICMGTAGWEMLFVSCTCIGGSQMCPLEIYVYFLFISSPEDTPGPTLRIINAMWLSSL